MRRINFYLMVLITAFAFSSCMKPPKNLDDLKVNSDKSPIEAHNGKVEGVITVKVPAKFMHKKIVAELIPVLEYADGTVEAAAISVQGEKVEGNAKKISYESGGTVSVPFSFDFEEAMRISELKIKAKVTLGDKAWETEAIKVSDGVIATATLACPRENAPALGADKFQRIIPESTEADIHFLIQTSYLQGKELRAEDIKALKAYIKNVKATENKEFKNVEVSAYASPDGTEELNASLSKRRESAASKFVTKELKRAKVEELSNEDFLQAFNTPEDWAGFKKLMEASSIQDKELILRVLSMYNDPETREKEIKNLSAAYKEVAEDILPQLRRSKLTVNAELIGKSDEEIASLVDSDPNALSIEEILYAATLTDDLDKKLKIYEKATTVYFTDWRGFNDMGYIYFKQGKFDDAEAAFKKANDAKKGVAEVNNNMGIIALLNNDVAKAKEFFGKAAGAGEPLNYNLGFVSIKEADYKGAVKKYGNCSCNNAALAKILANDLKGATTALDANKAPNALTSYLKAIVSARQNNSDAALSNLKDALKAKAELKAKAATDIEFAKMFDTDEFKGLVK